MADVREDGHRVRPPFPFPPPTAPAARAQKANLAPFPPRSGSILCIGGPLLTMWLMPTEEELFLRYNPELQRRSLENRQQKQEDFDQFVRRLTEYNKSDKPSE